MWTNMIKKIAHHSAHPFGSSLMKHSHVSSSSGALWNARTSHPVVQSAGVPSCGAPTLPTPAISWTLHTFLGCGTDTWRVLGCCKGRCKAHSWRNKDVEKRLGASQGCPWRNEQGLPYLPPLLTQPIQMQSLQISNQDEENKLFSSSFSKMKGSCIVCSFSSSRMPRPGSDAADPCSAPQSWGSCEPFLCSTPLSCSHPLPEAHSSLFTNQRRLTAANQSP